MNWLARLLAEHRWLTGALICLTTAAALAGATRLEFDDEPRTIFQRQDDDFAQLEQMYAEFGADDNDVLLVIRSPQLFTPEVLNALRELFRQAAALDGIEHVASLFDVRRVGSTVVPLMPASDATPERIEQARQRALAHPAVAEQLLSADGQTMLAIVRLKGNALTTQQIGPILETIHATVASTTRGHPVTVLLTGHPSIRYDSLTLMRRELVKSIVINTIISIILGLLIFRRPAAVVLTTTGPTLGFVWLLGLMNLCGEKVNGLNSAVPPLIFAIGFTDAVHLMIDYRRCRQHGLSAIDGASQTVRDLGLPCLLTALTTGVGFASLLLASTVSVQRFGVWCGVGTVVTFVAGIVTFPWLAGTAVLGDRALIDAGPAAFDHQRHHWLRHVVTPVIHSPRWAAAAGVLLSLAMAPSPFHLTPDLRWTEAAPQTSETNRAMQACDQAFGGALLGYVVVEWPAGTDINRPKVIEALRDVHACIDHSAMFRGPFSVLNLLESLPGQRADLTDRAAQLKNVPDEVVNRLVRRDLRRLVVSFHTPDVGAAALVPALDDLTAELARVEQQHPGFRFTVTGTAAIAARNFRFMIADLGNSLGFEAVAVFLLMAIGFRSVYLGIMSMIPNLFPLLVVTSLLVWTGRPLTLTGALAFNLCLGLAVDDTIHFLLRLERERRVDGDLRAAMLRTFDAVGTALVTTTPILIGGFVTMLFSDTPNIRLFAQLSCVTLLAALLGDLFVLPALLLCLARNKGPEKEQAQGG